MASFPIPVISSSTTILTLGNGALPLSTQPGYYWYQWTMNGVDVMGANTNTLNVTTPGTYAVKVKGSTTAAVATSANKIIMAPIDNQAKSNHTKITTLKQPHNHARMYIY
ncbi:MAG: hypothetical protein IPJ20_23470 [Flammeovirgaceae bacterium]|nr:hypothetical protein [Flammeovirgaceae bacterium]